MVEVPDAVMAERVIAEALEFGEFEEVHDDVALGEHGQYSAETEWSLNDMNPDECNVDMTDDETVQVSGEIEATYQIQTSRARYNPPGKAHPAEYKTETVRLWITIEQRLDGLYAPTIFVEQ